MSRFKPLVWVSTGPKHTARLPVLGSLLVSYDVSYEGEGWHVDLSVRGHSCGFLRTAYHTAQDAKTAAEEEYQRHMTGALVPCEEDTPPERPDNVVPLALVEKVNMPLDKMLELAKYSCPEGVVIIGYDKDGDRYFNSSLSDGAAVLWLLEKTKQNLLDAEVP